MMLKGGLLLSALGAPLVVAASPGAAQTVEQLQQQIRQLQQQLQNLQNQVDQRAKQAQAPAPAPAAPPSPGGAPKATLSPANRPGILSPDGRDTIHLPSALHVDLTHNLG